MAFGPEDSPIEAKKKILESQSDVGTETPQRKSLRNFPSSTPEDWEKSDESNFDYMVQNKKSTSFLKKFLIFSVVFFLFSVSLASYLFFGGSNIVSSRNVDVLITGPVLITGGDELTLDISIVNNNSADLEFSDLLIEFPEGTRSADDISMELPRIRESLGTIPSGSVSKKRIKAIVFGEEGGEQTIKVTVEYRVSGSNAIFYSEGEYKVTIGSSPINLKISSPKDVEIGEEAEMIVTITSNSNNDINDVILSVEYPFGFAFKGAQPEPSFNESIWTIGKLRPKEERIIKIRGLFNGQDNEERTVRFLAGIVSDRNNRVVGIPLVSFSQSITIKKPSLGLNLSLNGEFKGEYISQAGSSGRYSVIWSNNTSDRFRDVSIEVKVEGDAFNRQSTQVERGFFRSIDNTIVWDKNTNENFAFVNPGEKGSLDFKFSSIDPRVNFLDKNSQIKIVATILGRIISSDSSTDETFSSTITRTIKLASNMDLSSRLVYSVGEFVNTGPIPPTADKETTYTVIWSITNELNDVVNTKVKASLPSYVRWLGTTVPSGENISWNVNQRELVWDVGLVDTSGGSLSPVKEVTFQVSFLPSLSQVGRSPVIVSDMSIEGTDTFTGGNILIIKRELNTNLSTDPNFSRNDGKVVN